MAEIQTKHFPNASIEQYRCTSLLLGGLPILNDLFSMLFPSSYRTLRLPNLFFSSA
jgi:hypothetical protein